MKFTLTDLKANEWESMIRVGNISKDNFDGYKSISKTQTRTTAKKTLSLNVTTRKHFKLQPYNMTQWHRKKEEIQGLKIY